ncbi:sensor histidine kinase [Phytohabitans flavus]|uniref:histidine kinase n=1 Tax=Phytohabitans flavus TaxID=1076124 RepID=A0A6F8XIR9_9ACTN|nr:histidine kinase [Phytohabitans flavus]BCB73703.1 two-component sensor histidine kinase [Phytohabitans flavus]
MNVPRPAWQEWLPDAVAGLIVATLGLIIAILNYGGFNDYAPIPLGGLSPDREVALLVVVAVVTGAAVAASRPAPGPALALVWMLAGIHVVVGVPILVTELAIAAVAFGTARWGSTAVVWLSALSIPSGATVAVLFLAPDIRRILSRFLRLSALDGLGDTWQPFAAVIGAALLGVPWMAGMVLRVAARARTTVDLASADIARAEADRAQARQIARLREDQAQLARDVHDVVGHSLAVILAQAESGQYLPDGDPAALKTTLANIATSARTSLQSVRQVLSATQEGLAASTPDLDSLVEGLRTSGHEVVSTQTGAPQPLPPELDLIAFRTLQEMVTNAMKHGRRDRPITVERRWPDGDWEATLRISVSNAAAAAKAADWTAGQGLTGMRQRVESAGGRLDVDRHEVAGEPRFTATAWIPVWRPLP